VSTRLLVVLAIILLAGCSGAPGASVALAEPTATPTPTPEPTPSPWWKWASAACVRGTPVPGAAPYAGGLHPLIVYDAADEFGFDINADLPDGAWPWQSPIQLVLCAHHEKLKATSCGLYKTEDGQIGKVVRYQDKVTVRVVVAQTGKVLQKKVMTHPIPKCPKTITYTLVPTWEVTNEVTNEQIDAYATGVSKQAVK
jgi:hypothetical protein